MLVPHLVGHSGLGLGAAAALWAAAAVAGASRGGRDSAAALAAMLGLGGALVVAVALAGGSETMTLASPFALGPARIEIVLDSVSRWFLLPIGFGAVLVALFSPGYLHHLRHRVALGYVWSALAIMSLSMVGVVLAGNALFFLVAWESMALSSFALVAADHEQRAVRHAAIVYLGATRVGTGLLMGGFLWAHQVTGSWSFAAWTLAGPGAVGPAVLIFLGLAAKAGSWPFHLWLPIAHPAAPAPASGLMSGVMVKTAIYGMVRLLVVGPISAPFLGPLMIGLGAVSALWGVLFALLQTDLKRMLAYSTVENVGIIVLALGVSTVGQTLGLPLVFEIGLAGALLHSLNHAAFKTLLFLSAGAVDARVHTREMDQLGGLSRRMPWTTASFMVGCASICALPPFNGFVSEWLVYRGLVALAAARGSVATRLTGLLLFGWLALVGALALACFTRAAGIAFLGRARSGPAGRASEAGAPMVAALAVAATACLLLGIGAGPALAAIAGVIETSGHGPSWLASLAVPPIGLFALLVAGLIGSMWVGLAPMYRAHPVRRYVTWECGFGALSPRMQYTATSFGQPIARLFGTVYRYSVRGTIGGSDRRHFPETVSAEPVYEPYLETRLYAPVLHLIQRSSGTFLMRLQAGSIHQYLGSMVVALVVLIWLGYHA